MTVDACPRPGILAEPSDRAGKRCRRWRRSSTGSTVERRKVGHVGASTSCGDHPPHTQEGAFMRVVVPGHGAVRRAPLPLGPSVEILVDDQDGAELAAAHLTIPAGGGMPEHTHGAVSRPPCHARRRAENPRRWPGSHAGPRHSRLRCARRTDRVGQWIRPSGDTARSVRPGRLHPHALTLARCYRPNQPTNLTQDGSAATSSDPRRGSCSTDEGMSVRPYSRVRLPRRN